MTRVVLGLWVIVGFLFAMYDPQPPWSTNWWMQLLITILAGAVPAYIFDSIINAIAHSHITATVTKIASDEGLE